MDTYGCQEQTLFNGYYDSYCYMPLMVFEGHSGKMILPLLKPGRPGKSVSFENTILWLIACLREVWPKTVITVRGDRLSCHTFLANRLRIFLYAAAYILMLSVREKALRGTRLKKVSILSIREKLMLYAVSIRIHKNKICVDFARHNPMNAELAHALHYYSNGNSS